MMRESSKAIIEGLLQNEHLWSSLSRTMTEDKEYMDEGVTKYMKLLEAEFGASLNADVRGRRKHAISALQFICSTLAVCHNYTEFDREKLFSVQEADKFLDYDDYQAIFSFLETLRVKDESEYLRAKREMPEVLVHFVKFTVPAVTDLINRL